MKSKCSKYNYFIDYKNKKLLFNGLSGVGFCMTLQEYGSLYPLLSDLDSFHEKYITDFERFKKLGYIVDDDFDEIAYIKFKNREAVFLDKSYRLFINPTLECNFNCWYCYEEHPKGYMSEKTMEKIKKHLLKKVENKEISYLNLSWFGGEPLLYFYEVMYPLAKFAKELCKENNIPFISTATTNAFCIDEKMLPFLNEISLSGFQITLDGHRERHDKIRNRNGEPSYERIIKNINLLCEQVADISITLRINYDNQTLKAQAVTDILYDIPERNRCKIQFDLQRVWQTAQKTKLDTNNEDVASFVDTAKAAGYRYISCAGSLPARHFYNCYASKFHYLEINYDGKIYKCTARGYNDDYVLGELLDDGSVKWDEKRLSKLYDKPTFDNPMCLDCKYLPLCWGPCPQKIVETSVENIQNICNLKYAERPMKEKIIDLYETSLKNIKQKNEVS